jgi:predicted RNase H-like nuclease (RuvC/YqgF family)
LFLKQLNEMVNLANELKDSENRHEMLKKGLTDIYVNNLRSHGCTYTHSEIQTFLKIDIELNAQGIGVWLDKR